MAKNILTIDQVREALFLDADADYAMLEQYSRAASHFIKQKTGYDYAQDEPVEPLAVTCAKLYVRQLHFGAQGYNKEHDYTLGLTALISDLQDLARAKLMGESDSENQG